MISVVIATLDDAGTLGQTLSALVPAAVDGLVREVILADGGSTDATLDIGDDAGARIVAGTGPASARLAMGCAVARSDWLLILHPGSVPPEGWARAVAGHLKQSSGAAYWGGRRWPLGRASALTLLVPRKLYEDAGGYRDDLIRRLGRRARRLEI